MVSDQVKSLIKIDSSKKVLEIEVSLEVRDCKGNIQVTDVMLQGGPIVTIWTGHPSELRWQHDW
ncbi:hypothetical protein [Bacillus wiedmannii]|uniref:hypothetical protein n=1 Tax=Bacillus wiedmannii TaxID=1890302 RepID=UPI000BF1E6AA|nr:hypothetical protein [Bacillus wiedmannii]PEN61608.1 hypothetical protein CN576_21475 [Bacillus wiedmannii]PHA62854.1 hypothetical protein COE75_16580 [Bacillus wiedmannii]